jgi:hypothetical protein
MNTSYSGIKPIRRHGPGHRKRRRIRRMAMHHRPRLGIGLVNLQMQQQFAGQHPVPGQNLSIQVGEANVSRLRSALLSSVGVHSRYLGAQPHADVAAVAVHILPLPQLAPHVDDLRPQTLGLKRVGNHQRRLFLHMRHTQSLATVSTISLTCSLTGTAVCSMVNLAGHLLHMIAAACRQGAFDLGSLKLYRTFFPLGTTSARDCVSRIAIAVLQLCYLRRQDYGCQPHFCTKPPRP